MKTQALDKILTKVRGHVRAVLRTGDVDVVLYDGHNDLTDLAAEILAGVAAGDPDSLLAFISVGSGAFTSPPPAVTGENLVDPIPTETEMRSPEATTGIASRVSTGSIVTYTAVFRPTEAVGAEINEFGLLTTDLRMFSHAIDTSISTPAESKVKSGITYLLIEWTLDLTIT